jgi:hypothetical protein
VAVDASQLRSADSNGDGAITREEFRGDVATPRK